MKWNEAEMVALVGRRPADWEGRLTYRCSDYVMLISCDYVLMPNYVYIVGDGLEDHMHPKSWHCQNWVDPIMMW